MKIDHLRLVAAWHVHVNMVSACMGRGQSVITHNLPIMKIMDAGLEQQYVLHLYLSWTSHHVKPSMCPSGSIHVCVRLSGGTAMEGGTVL